MAKTTAFACGVSDAYYATLTSATAEGVTTWSYGTPAVLGGTASVRVTYQTGENKVYESDALVRANKRINSAEIEFQSRSVDVVTEMSLMFSKTASEAGDYEVSGSDNGANCAFGFARSRTDGGYDAYWFYNAVPAASDIEANTAEESESTPASSFKFTAMAHPTTGKIFRRKVCANATALAAFFATVQPSTSGGSGGSGVG